VGSMWMFYNAMLEVISYMWSLYDCQAGIHMCDRAQSFCYVDFIITIQRSHSVKLQFCHASG
jgi:hypothetical protein